MAQLPNENIPNDNIPSEHIPDEQLKDVTGGWDLSQIYTGPSDLIIQTKVSNAKVYSEPDLSSKVIAVIKKRGTAVEFLHWFHTSFAIVRVSKGIGYMIYYEIFPEPSMKPGVYGRKS